MVDGEVYDMSIDFSEAQTESMLAPPPLPSIDDSIHLKWLWGGTTFGNDLHDQTITFINTNYPFHRNELVELMRLYHELMQYGNEGDPGDGITAFQVQDIRDTIQNAMKQVALDLTVLPYELKITNDRMNELQTQFNGYVQQLNNAMFMRREMGSVGLRNMIRNAQSLDELIYLHALTQNALNDATEAEVITRLTSLNNQIEIVLRDRFMTALYLYSLTQP